MGQNQLRGSLAGQSGEQSLVIRLDEYGSFARQLEPHNRTLPIHPGWALDHGCEKHLCDGHADDAKKNHRRLDRARGYRGFRSQSAVSSPHEVCCHAAESRKDGERGGAPMRREKKEKGKRSLDLNRDADDTPIVSLAHHHLHRALIDVN